MPERLLRELRQQWHDSALLRQGVWGIGIVLLLYAVLWLDDRLTLTELRAQRLLDNRAELHSLEQQQHWPALLDRLQERQDQWLSHAWQARTVGLARAQVQEFVNEAAAGSEVEGIDIRRTELAEPQPFEGGLHEMRGRINASAEASQVPWDWIAALDQHSPWLLLDSVQIRVGRRSGVALELEFRVLIRGLEDRS